MRQHKHKESRMRKRNWKQYNKQLIQRGSLTFLIDPKLFKRQKTNKRIGRPQEFSRELIVMLMMVKIHYRCSYRFLEGFMKSIHSLSKQTSTMPTYSLICKRAAFIKDDLPKLNSSRSQVIILDASGIKIEGEGEWKVKIHGKGRPRKWLKIHIAIDAKTQEIVAETTTESTVVDSTMTRPLLNQIVGSINTIIGDGAYDRSNAREAIRQRRSKALIPPPRNARYKGIKDDRDEALSIIEGFGGDEQARSLWGKLTGYSYRALVETAFSRMKRLFGDRLFSKIPEKQAVENRLRCVILNKMRSATA